MMADITNDKVKGMTMGLKADNITVYDKINEGKM